ncbi:hypothetical protein [Sphingomonas sp. OTU376]|uniref:hypothetical protein n=1 Tax=Sphingomonas sp. OTU376 TaxID=3043863 RepID=UPI00313E35F7
MTSIAKPMAHAITLIAAGALGTLPASTAAQTIPVPVSRAGTPGTSSPADETLSCAQIDAEVNVLLEKLGHHAAALEEASAQVAEVGAAGSRAVSETDKKTTVKQGLASAASDVANLVPGGGFVSGVIGSAAGAAVAADNRKLTVRQQSLSSDMRAKMVSLQEQANAAIPDAMRLQHLNSLQAAKACPTPDR